MIAILTTRRMASLDTIEKYNACFSDVLGVPVTGLEKLEYQGIETWDSVGHMALVSAIEDAFDIMMDTDDILDFSSYAKGLGILEKYGVEI